MQNTIHPHLEFWNNIVSLDRPNGKFYWHNWRS